VHVLPLQKGILYGPIHSRRLGKSLGINLMPSNYKLCSFNCVYCHYGWTKVHTRHARRFLKDLPEFDDVIKAITNALISKQQFDYITFSGNGEPTLYPQFASLAAELAKLRDRHRPDVKIALLSNSSGLSNPALKKSITYIDLPVFKLDAGKKETFSAINRPVQGVDFEEVFEQLSCLSGILIQTVLVRGTPCNTTEEELGAYLEKIKIIQPRKVHIYSIDRPVPNAKLERVLPERLEEIAHLGREKTGIEMQAFYLT
jgi:wyosine [tRNA(Phe)-imidazoG37] synthetase (radical SAM superfamily)